MILSLPSPIRAMHSVTAALRSLSLAGRRSLHTSAARWEQAAAAAAEPAAAVASTSAWTPQTQRTGVLARKLGMTALWQEGIRVPVTVLHVSSSDQLPVRTRVFAHRHLSLLRRCHSSTMSKSSLPTLIPLLPPLLLTIPSSSAAHHGKQRRPTTRFWASSARPASSQR